MKESDGNTADPDSWDAMKPEKQRPRARTQMAKAQKEEQDLHRLPPGIAHLLPRYVEDVGNDPLIRHE